MTKSEPVTTMYPPPTLTAVSSSTVNALLATLTVVILGANAFAKAEVDENAMVALDDKSEVSIAPVSNDPD